MCLIEFRMDSYEWQGDLRVCRYRSLFGRDRYATEEYDSEVGWFHKQTVDKEYFDWFKEKCKC